MKNILLSLFILFIYLFPILNAKEVSISNNSDWVSALNSLKPGDTAILGKGKFSAGGYSQRDKTITLLGTKDSPITIIGSGPDSTILDGEGSKSVLIIENSSHVIIENLAFTNPSVNGDGRYTRISVNSSTLAEGLVIRGGNNITVRKSLFDNIGTRGIFTQRNSDGGHLKYFLLEKNVFFNIGLDTASGDINMNSGENWTIRNNLFAGNTDGIVNAGTTLGGGIIENNIFMNHWQEDNIDLKGHRGEKQTIVRKNIFYNNRCKTGLTVQNSSRNIFIDDNIFYHGNPVGQIWIHGRNHAKGTVNEPVKNIDIYNNVLIGDNVKDDRGIMIQYARDKGPTHAPVEILNITVMNNYIANQPQPIINRIGDNAKISNNKLIMPPNERLQVFKDIEMSIISAIENIFPLAIIQNAYSEAKLNFTFTPNTNNTDVTLNAPDNLRIL